MDNRQSTPFLVTEGVGKEYRSGKSQQILNNITRTIVHGDFVSLMGPSGSGKSTLLNILGALDTDYTGTVRIGSCDLHGQSDDYLSYIRSKYIGFVFQQFNLLPRSTVFQNVEMPLIFAGIRGQKRLNLVRTALQKVRMDIKGMEDRSISELAGGERQRIAIARALVHLQLNENEQLDPREPGILLADEPTGSLDQDTGGDIMDLFTDLNKNYRLTIFMVTHDPNVARRASTRWRLSNGMVLMNETI